jgi:hypothetical protein
MNDFKIDEKAADIVVENIPAAEIKEEVKIIAPETEAPKKGRGRPKKQINNDPSAVASVKPERKKKVAEKSLLDELKEKGKAYSEAPKIEQSTIQGDILPEQPSSNLLNGYLILLICDAFLPLIVTKIAKAAGKNITSKQLKLTATEKKELEPLADAAAASIMPSLSPTSQFFLALSSVYISKAV